MSQPLPLRSATCCFAFALAIFLTTRRDPATADSVPTALLPVMIANGTGHDFTPYVPAFAEEFPSAEPPYAFLKESRRGRIVSAYPVAPALLLTPAYAPAVWHKQATEDPSPAEWLAWAREVEPISAATIAALGVAIFFLLASQLLPMRSAALALTFIYSFGTDVFSAQSQALWQHTTGMPLYLLGLLFAVRATRPGESGVRRRDLVLCGLAFALAVACRRTLAVAICPVAIWLVLRQPRAWPWLGAPVALAGIALITYNSLQFGSLTGTNPSTSPWRNPDPLGTLGGLLISPARGLLIYFPLGFLSIAGFVSALRHHDRYGRGIFIALGIGAIAHLGFIWAFRWNTWWGGHCFGARYLTDAMPAMVLLLVPFFARRQALRIALAVPLAAAAIAIHTLGAYAYPNGGWDAIPVSIDRRPERAWDWRDNPVYRCALATVRNHHGGKPRTIKDWRVSYADFPDRLSAAAGTAALTVPLTVTNPTEKLWVGYPKINGSRLLALHAQTMDSENLLTSATPVALLRDVAPGDSVQMRIRVPLPQQPGDYLMRLGLVQESVASFEENGAALAEIQLQITR